LTKPAIGFIGLGLMGAGMCQRMLDLDYPMTVIANRSRETIARGAVDGRADALAFAVKNAKKDVGYYKTMTEEAGADSIMSKCALQALEQADAAGYADRMVSEMVDFFARRFKGG